LMKFFEIEEREPFLVAATPETDSLLRLPTGPTYNLGDTCTTIRTKG
jgi:hypothetical protein